MPTGTVKWFSPEKGYGFIMPDDGGDDVFVHIRDSDASGIKFLREKQKVSYDLETDRKTGKTKAGNLKLL